MVISHVFGPTRSWPDQDLIALSDDFDPRLVLDAYRSGVFPMPLHDTGFDARMGWWSPVRRAVLPLDGLRVSRSLRKSAGRYTVSVNRDFQAVLDGCADPHRPGGWIDADVRDVYTTLHEAGHVVSVETWTRDGVLAGGLYGLCLGGLFAGESMFHRRDIGTDASKIALVHLVECLRADGVPRLLDVQWLTDHLASLGAIEVSRPAYLAALDAALTLPAPRWPPPGGDDA